MGIRSVRNSPCAICSLRAIGRILNYDQRGRIYGPPRARRYSGVHKVSVLSELAVGETAMIATLELPESVQNHLMHMGFVPDARITVLRRAPAGDPTVYAIDGMEIALRRETASSIRVRPQQDREHVEDSHPAQDVAWAEVAR